MNDALKGEFEVVGLPKQVTKVALRHFGEVDFTKISLQQAEVLHAGGCVYLKKLEKAASKTKATPRKDSGDG